MIGLKALDEQPAKTQDKRIKQKPLLGSETTKPTLLELKGRLAAKIGDNPKACTILLLDKWIQAPISNTGATVGNCGDRALDLAPLLNAPGKEFYNSDRNLANRIGKKIEEKWKSNIDDNVTQGASVVVKGSAPEVGGDKSGFVSSFHVIIFLAAGVDDEGAFYVVFDPDVKATMESRALWDRVTKERNKATGGEIRNLEPEKLHDILCAMILGEEGAVLGPLFRKYYPDRSKTLAQIKY